MRGRPFPKGVSGNPGGRPKGLARMIREKTGGGAKLVEAMIGVLEGNANGVRARDQIDAANWLADRGFGKPPQAVDLEVTNVEPARGGMIILDNDTTEDQFVETMKAIRFVDGNLSQQDLRTWARDYDPDEALKRVGVSVTNRAAAP